MKIRKEILILVALSVLTSSNNVEDRNISKGKNNCKIVHKEEKNENKEEQNEQENVTKSHQKNLNDKKFEDFYDEERHSGIRKYLLMNIDNGEVWNQYKHKYQLRFAEQEEDLKYRKIYNKNLALLALEGVKKQTYELGENEFLHLDFEEFEQEKCGTKVPQGMKPRKKRPPRFFSFKIPNSLSYTHLMQPVQNQGTCGCCWAFATLALIEASMKRKDSNFRTVLSPSYLNDCDSFNFGCKGGWPAASIGKFHLFFNNHFNVSFLRLVN